MVKLLEFKVTKQTIKRVDRLDPATDSVDYLEAKFDFTTNDWDGKVKTALFRLGTKVYKSIVNSSGVCTVPWEVLVASSESTSSLGSKNKVFVSLTGTTGSVVITTNEVRVELATSGKAYGDGENSGTPTPDEFTQFVNTVKDEVATINDTAEAVKQAASDVEKTADDLAKSIDDVEAIAKSNEETAGIIKNQAANAFKGTASGEVIRVDDVSCIEHTANVNVRGKNLFDISKIAEMLPSVSAYVSEVGENYIIVTTPDGYTANGYCTIAKTLKELCPQLEIGKTYTLNATTESNSTNIYLPNVGYSWIFGHSMVMTADILNSTVTFYGLSSQHGQGVGDCTISNIQIELGTEATEYTPYIDPSTVTLTRCGKNILGYADNFSITQDGLTIEYDADEQIFTINGTPEKASFPINFGSHLFDKFSLPIGTNVALSIEHISGTLSAESMTNVFYLGNSDSAGGGRNNWFSVPFPINSRKTNISTAQKKYFTHTWLYVGGEYNVTFTNYKFKVQLEIGNEATDYEEFRGAKYTPTNDGTVDISTLSPIMTLLTDKSGITIECEYNRDTNIVMGDIETAIDGILAIQNAIIGGDYS